MSYNNLKVYLSVRVHARDVFTAHKVPEFMGTTHTHAHLNLQKQVSFDSAHHPFDDFDTRNVRARKSCWQLVQILGHKHCPALKELIPHR